MQVYARHLTGQCRTGGDSSGTLVHALPALEDQPPGSWVKMSGTALCGRTYGRHSAGWSDYCDREVTCPRCLKKMQRLGVTEVIQPEAVS